MGRTAHGISIEREVRGAQERERRGGGGVSKDAWCVGDERGIGTNMSWEEEHTGERNERPVNPRQPESKPTGPKASGAAAASTCGDDPVLQHSIPGKPACSARPSEYQQRRRWPNSTNKFTLAVSGM